jgi:hypothetical protein
MPPELQSRSRQRKSCCISAKRRGRLPRAQEVAVETCRLLLLLLMKQTDIHRCVADATGHFSVGHRFSLSNADLIIGYCPSLSPPPGQEIQAKASPAAKLPQPRPEALQAFADVPAPSTQLNPKGAPSRRNDVDGSPHRISSSFSIPRFLRRKFLLTCLVLSTVDCRHHH